MDWIESQRFAQTRDGTVRTFGIDPQFSTGQLIRRDPAEDYMGVGNSRRIAHAITGRPGDGARAFRTHPKTASRIHASDRPAARADGMDIEHGYTHRERVDA